MKFKEKAILNLNDIIYSKKNKLTKKDRETLILLREDIRNEKNKSGLLQLGLKAAKFIGINLDDT